MSLSRMGMWLLLVAAVALSACAEQAVCTEGRVRGRDTVVVRCSTGKIPVCGSSPEVLYDPGTGALLPAPQEPNLADQAMRAAFTGACPGGIADICTTDTEGMTVCRPGCRPRPTCQGAAGEAPTCANGETAVCLMGRDVEIAPPPPPPMDGGPPEDAGTDAGTDAGSTDAGSTDAGSTDAGSTDAG